jgi:hypothetical protein
MGNALSRKPEYTFKHNKTLGRHGWLRLTPAYSVKLVNEIVHAIGKDSVVLDPFSGTGTTGLAAFESGIKAYLFDINPFLVWLSATKCRSYSQSLKSQFEAAFKPMVQMAEKKLSFDNWIPSIYNIDRWWDRNTIHVLAAIREALTATYGKPGSSQVGDLFWVAFCRLIIETSSAAFNHVSMSFHDKPAEYERHEIIELFESIALMISDSLLIENRSTIKALLVDSISPKVAAKISATHIITSPPYPNRISYIRELRPYMYWTGFMHTSLEASDIDWSSVGGTWGSATSKLMNWNRSVRPFSDLLEFAYRKIVASNGKSALLMANYTMKYFEDMYRHFESIRALLANNCQMHYIIGNSSFFGVEVDTPTIYKDILMKLDYANIEFNPIRKRNSKKNLFEYHLCSSCPNKNC